MLFAVLSIAQNASGDVLPAADAFPPLVAGVREPQFSIRREGYEQKGGGFDAASVSFGDYLPVVNFGRGECDCSHWQFGIDGSLYATFDLDTSSYNLFNTDYQFGLHLQYSDGEAHDDGSFSLRLRVFHFSSHLGDEFVLDNPEIDRTNSSFEDVELVLAYTYSYVRAYAGGGSIFRSNSLDELDPLHFRWGLEFRSNEARSTGYWLAAGDFETKQRTEWQVGQSYLAGRGYRGSDSREVRFLFEYFNGNSPHGQFFRDRLEYLGLGVYFLV